MLRYCAKCNEVVPANEYARHIAGHRPGSTYAWRKLRDLILDRDHHRCVVCGSTVQLEVHHKNGDWRDNDPGNLEVRCLRHNRHGNVSAA